ncbi:MAG: hypothetical protein O2931_09015 [Planctomycetota bacterium]|nr:hypothetical protein [Planctomycetota bacterium]MDA1178923.1 hypothetical protein [Planctomycetota bacterium]
MNYYGNLLRRVVSRTIITRALLVLVVSVGVSRLLTTGWTADVEPTGRLEALMERKLVSAQRVLEGLATEDFDLMRIEASRLHLYSEEAGWQVLQTEEYRRLSNDFRNAAQRIQTSAKEGNLDGASLGYIKLTMTCLECHRHVRQSRGEKGDESQAKP